MLSIRGGMLALAWSALSATSGTAQQGGDSVDRIQALLARPAEMCGSFEQSKKLIGLRRPVRSAGRFCIVTATGILWRTQRPFSTTLRLTRDEIVESQGERVTKRLSASDEPTVHVISELLFSVLSGDLQRLKAGFTITATVDDSTWTARLDPRDAGMRRVITAITLSGGTAVRRLTISEASGDNTDITLSGIVNGPSALHPDDVRALRAPSVPSSPSDIHAR